VLDRDQLVTFLKALCRYYSDFLETDFHASRAPSRQITASNRKGQLLGFDLATHPEFAAAALRGLLTRFDGPLPIVERPKATAINREGDISSDPPPLYRQVFELYKNRELLDKYNAYLYFFPFTVDGTSYPLIYIPVDIDLSDTQDAFTLDPGPVLYINTRAIRHVTSFLSERNNARWSIDVPDRQLYLAAIASKDLTREIQRLLNALTDIAESPAVQVERLGDSSSGRGLRLQVSAYLMIAPQGDEALVTDYEALLVKLQQNPDDANINGMLDLIDGFLFQNPTSVTDEVERELADEPMTSRIGYPSPIPLNKEQLLVARALRKDDCKRVVIEGPPGTGKSHTITGLVFEALRDGKSVLLVSDKKEALDVVEDKINDVLNTTKVDDTFQNPILRLGTKNNNFARIFFEGNLAKIRGRQSALQGRAASLGEALNNLQGQIETDARADVLARVALHSPDAIKALAFERAEAALLRSINYDEIEAADLDSLPMLGQAVEELRNSVATISATIGRTEPLGTYANLESQLLRGLSALQKLVGLNAINGSPFLVDVSDGKLDFLAALPARVLAERKPLVGYFFSGRILETIRHEILVEFPNSGIVRPQDHLAAVPRDVAAFRTAAGTRSDLEPFGADPFAILRDGNAERYEKSVTIALDSLRRYRKAFSAIALTATRLGYCLDDIDRVVSLGSADQTARYRQFVDYWKTADYLAAVTRTVRPRAYLDQRAEIEQRLTLTMSSLLDKAVLGFNDTQKSNAVTMRKLIRERKQIPQTLLPALAKAFPCIIIGIRELGTYLPFEFGVFDVVIIDEASQVSIAQALPAILRAKKAVVLGDPKQFSNVKAAFASTDLNTAAFSRVRGVLSEAVRDIDRDLARHLLDKAGVFNIKTSVLEFARYLANYSAFLRKHFRGYSELISYSNETFYQRLLQVMKIRSRPIAEVLKFDVIDAATFPAVDGENTNEAEAAFVLAELERLVELEFPGTVAVITPFTDQQGLILSKVLASPHARALRKTLRVKVMTFDTAQGEERDLILYSMVERPGQNTLRYIFPTSMSAASVEEDGDLRKQRLNVGLSRAKETVHFVLSKPIGEYTGEIGNALRVFDSERCKPDFASLVAATDLRSPMERQILQYISQTSFYREHEQYLEVMPQFPIGQLIRQLDPYAEVPRYVSDFLIVFNEVDVKPLRAIVEYDGIESHFDDAELVNAFTIDQLRAERDVERMRTIESYGYPIISLNKFVLGRDPIGVIDALLWETFKKKASGFDERITPLLRSFAPERKRMCSRCGRMRPIEAFFSERLESGAGRICSDCDPKRGLEVRELPSAAQRGSQSLRQVRPSRQSAASSAAESAQFLPRIEDQPAVPAYFQGQTPSAAQITAVLTEMARAGPLPSSRYALSLVLRKRFFGRFWLSREQLRMYDDAFEAAVRWLYTGDERNTKYGED
jgi:hypothetical protein